MIMIARITPAVNMLTEAPVPWNSGIKPKNRESGGSTASRSHGPSTKTAHSP